MAPPSLAVVIPTRGRGEHLTAAIQAVLSQRYTGSHSVTVLDNDRYPAASAGVMAMNDGEVSKVVVNCRNKSEGVNLGVPHTRGDALVFLDDDDLIQPGYLQAMGEALMDFDAVGARLDSVALNPGTHRRRAAMQSDGLPSLMGRPFIIGAGLGVWRAAFEAVGGYDVGLTGLEDVDLSWRLVDAGARLGFAADAVLWYRYRAGLGDTFRQERTYGEFEAALYAKHRATVLPRRALTSVRAWAEIPRQVAIGNLPGAMTAAGHAAGRLKGSLKHRVGYL